MAAWTFSVKDQVYVFRVAIWPWLPSGERLGVMSLRLLHGAAVLCCYILKD